MVIKMTSYDVTKVVNAIILALNCGVKYLGKTKLMKLLFFADKEHLKRYGRPIFFDVYIKKPKGPVPLQTYSILSSYNDHEYADFQDELNILREWLEIEEKDVGQPSFMMNFKRKKGFDPEIFSESELKILYEIFNTFKEHTAEQISEESHRLPE